MGGDGGSNISSVDLSKLTGAAEERLRQLAQSGTHILFVCETEDRKALESHLKRSKVFDPKKYTILDASTGKVFEDHLGKTSVVIAFTDEARKTQYLDGVIETVFQSKKQGLHAKAKDISHIPSKASAYRWPSLIWSKVEEMFA